MANITPIGQAPDGSIMLASLVLVPRGGGVSLIHSDAPGTRRQLLGLLANVLENLRIDATLEEVQGPKRVAVPSSLIMMMPGGENP